jgi:hypothetical protein
VAEIKNMLSEIEADYPELQVEINQAIQTNSGRAVRLARQPAETKVNERRARYDDALARAQKMAMTIGGIRGYTDFGGINLESYAAGKLDHSIGPRPVFARDPLDELEIEEAFWTAATAAKEAGLPLHVYLKRHGWTDKEIAEVEKAVEKAAQQAQSAPEPRQDENVTGGSNGRDGGQAVGRKREPVGQSR